MSNPTSNFGWQMPTNTDLVTDLPADFEVFGQAVDTSLADLKGGTTGQILSKATNADMDFVWANANPGDITAVTAGTGISGGGTSGSVTITNDMATTITTNGDLLYGTGAGTYTRRGIGSTGQVLTVTGGVPTWAALPASTPTFIGCRAYASNDQTIPASTDVIIGFNNENFDSNGFHDNSTNNSRMTIPSGYAGKYLIFANLFYGGGFSGTNRVIDILKNGSLVSSFASGSASSNGFTISINSFMDLAVGDYVQIRTNSQGATGSLTVYGSSSLSPNQGATTFNLVYLGA